MGMPWAIVKTNHWLNDPIYVKQDDLTLDQAGRNVHSQQKHTYIIAECIHVALTDCMS